MKRLIVFLFVLAALPLAAQTTVLVSVTLNDAQVWALQQDYADYMADTNNVAITKVEWFRMQATNAVLTVADRRLKVRRQQLQSVITSKWPDLTPEQMTNVVEALPK